MPVQKGEKKQVKDLVQIDIDTALALYLKGYTHIPVLQRDGYSADWSSMQPLYLDDVLNNLMAFASDSKRVELLNPPKVDVAKVKEEIALEFKRNLLSDDEDDYEDDDPDWTEEPAQVEQIPDDDAVPEHERGPYEKPEVITVEQVTKVSEKTDKPPKWNILRVNKLSNEGWTNKQIADEYGVSEDTVRVRLIHYRSKS